VTPPPLKPPHGRRQVRLAADENDPRLTAAVKLIGDELARKFLVRDLTVANVERIVEHLDVLRTRLRLNDGVEVPALVPIVLQRYGYVMLVRADLEHDGIQATIRNLAVMFPDVHALADLAPAIRAAFPDYDPAKRLN
jgi:hypothetical protein